MFVCLNIGNMEPFGIFEGILKLVCIIYHIKYVTNVMAIINISIKVYSKHYNAFLLC